MARDRLQAFPCRANRDRPTCASCSSSSSSRSRACSPSISSRRRRRMPPSPLPHASPFRRPLRGPSRSPSSRTAGSSASNGRPQGRIGRRRPRCGSSPRGRRRPSDGRVSARLSPSARGCARCAPTRRRGSRASRARRSGRGSAETKRTRLWQIAATLAPLGDKELAVLASEGRFVTTLRLGVRPGTWRAETGENDYPYVVARRPAPAGCARLPRPLGRRRSTNYLTEQALLAFQGWEDLDRTGTVTGQTQVALFSACAPRPAARRPGQAHRDLIATAASC